MKVHEMTEMAVRLHLEVGDELRMELAVRSKASWSAIEVRGLFEQV